MNKLMILITVLSFPALSFGMGSKKPSIPNSAQAPSAYSGVTESSGKFIPPREEFDSCYFKITDDQNRAAIYQVKIPDGKTGSGLNTPCSLPGDGFHSITGITNALPSLCRTTTFKVGIYGTVSKRNTDWLTSCAVTRKLDSQSAVDNCKIGKTCYSDSGVKISRTGQNEFQFNYSNPITEHLDLYVDFNLSQAYASFFKVLMAPIYTNTLKNETALFTYDIQNTTSFREKYPFECRLLYKNPYSEEFENEVVVFRSNVDCQKAATDSIYTNNNPIKTALNRQCSSVSTVGGGARYLIDIIQIKGTSLGYKGDSKQITLYGENCN